MFAVPKGKPVQNRKKLRDFQPFIRCPLCNGYLIEATTIEACLHSFCRSCIVSHLNAKRSCPTCNTGEPIQLAQLRADNQLRAIVYKLVSGLYQSESQRIHAFHEQRKVASHSSGATTTPQIDLRNKDNNGAMGSSSSSHSQTHNNNDVTTTATTTTSLHKMLNNNNSSGNGSSGGERIDDDVEFYSGDDPISLSLEYHPKSVIGCDKSSIPAVRFLLCPAAVTVHHLQRFLSSKFSLNFEASTSAIDIHIIYDDEVLPAQYTLMDVAYIFHWKRKEPLQLFYQILVISPDVPTTPDAITVPATTSGHCHSIPTSIRSSCSPNSSNITSMPRHKIHADSDPVVITKLDSTQLNEPQVNDQLDNLKMLSESALMSMTLATTPATMSAKSPAKTEMLAETPAKISVTKPQTPTPPPTPRSPPKTAIVNNSSCDSSGSSSSSSSSDSSQTKNFNNNYPSEYKEDSNNRYSISTDHPAKPTKVTIVKNNNNNNHSKISTNKSNSSTTATKQRVSTDFKSLRSNDYKFISDFVADAKIDSKLSKSQASHVVRASGSKDVTPATTAAVPFAFNETHSTHIKKQEDYKMPALTMPKICASAAIPSPNIVVSIPKCRRSSLSDENYENLSLSTLKTANKKSKSTMYKNSISVDENLLRRYAGEDVVPKLKITVPKETPEPKSQMDFAEIANYIGLKRISPERGTDAASPPYERHSSSHKKRKKSGKHSRDPGTGKRRKLHAEISSQEEESLKLKVKITGSKPSKHERKSSSNSSSGDDSLGAKKSPSPEIVMSASDESKESLSELRKVRIKVTKSMSPDKDVIITNVTYPDPPTVQPVPISTKTNNLKTSTPQPTFAMPKQPEIKHKMAPPVLPPPKTYLPGMKTMSRPTIPDVRPVANSNRMFSPPHTPTYPSYSLSRPQAPSPRLLPISASPPLSATLKRSMSVDTAPKAILPPTKQPKLEPFSRKNSIPNLIRTGASKVQMRTPSPDIRPPPVAPKPAATYYNSTMSSTYTREITTKKPAPISLPPSSISVTKMTDIPKLSVSSNNATLTRPALEIVRISSSAPTADQQHNMAQKNTAMQSPPASVQQAARPPQHTIPLMKIKKVGMSTGVSTLQHHGHKIPDTKTTPPHSPMCDVSGALDLSGHNSRSPSVEKSPNAQATMPPALVTPRKKNTTPPIAIIDITTPTKSPTNSPTKSSASELHKRPEQHSTPPPEYTGHKPVNSVPKPSLDLKNDSSVPKQITGKNLSPTWMIAARHRTTTEGQTLLDQKLCNLKESEQQLHNLKMLSETVLHRDRLRAASMLAVTKPTQRLLTTVMPKLNEIGGSKTMRTPPVRQQNASVRNIPNPSALAFRHQIMSPKPVSPPPVAVSSSGTTVPYAAYTAVTAQKFTPMVCSPSSYTSAPTTTSKVFSPKFQIDMSKGHCFAGNGNADGSNDQKAIAAKKNLHIEQVAATLLAAAASDSGSTITT